jgi:hypothetical protein
LNFLFYYLIFNELNGVEAFRKIRNLLVGVTVLGLISGNFWVYPKKISQGWDSTLAHLNWFELQEAAEAFVVEANLRYSEIGTGFPNIGPRETIELNGVEVGFKEKDLATDCYVLYSNVMNDFTDEEIDELEEHWEEIFREEKMGLCAIIYQNKNAGQCGN